LTSSPLGSYSYADPAHLHAAIFVDSSSGSNDFSASYDAARSMLTRAPSEGLPQQKLSYDNEGRLTAWQNAPSSPTSSAQYLYDGEGNRVEQQATTSGTTTTTVYVGDIEQVATTGGTSTTTTYYYAAGQRIALAVNGTLSYLASDFLGSATVALDGSGTPIASQLYAPYGSTRYSNGAMPTDYGFTGQYADASTGLDYYGARYYDPTLGQFASADTVMDGLNRYGYVDGNPVSYTDPSGHEEVALQRDSFGGDLSGEGGAGDLTGLANAILQLIFGTTVAAESVASNNATATTTIPLAGTPDAGATFTVNGKAIMVLPNGDLEVTTHGAGYASTSDTYAVGSADWIKWSHDIDVAYTDTDVWNSRTAPKATTGTTTTTTTTGGGSVPQSGLPGGTGSGGSWGSGNPGVPTGTPPFTGGTLAGVAAAGSIILGMYSHQNDLPSGGQKPYIPPKKGRGQPFWHPGQGGFEDANGDIWKWDKSGHGGGHWDVSDKKGGGHINVNPNGSIRGAGK